MTELTETEAAEFLDELETVTDATHEDAEGDAGEEPEEKKKPRKRRAVAAKRGPGRPPKKPAIPALKFSGIQKNPHDVDNMFEFVTAFPESFKKLFAYMKNLKSRPVYLRFRASTLTLLTRDHENISRVVAVVHGSRAHWFYCEKEFDKVINRTQVEKMFASISKDYFKLTIMIKKDDPQTINIVLKKAETGKENSYKFSVTMDEPDKELFDAETEITAETEGKANKFPVQFTLSAKDFKQDISDAAGYADTITFEKSGNEPLQLSYAAAGMAQVGVYRESEKIHLYSEVDADQIFRCNAKVSNMKSLASSMVADRVRILLRETGDIMLISLFDADTKAKADKKDVLIVHTLTKLM